MTNPVQTGTALIEGIGKAGSAITISGFATFLLQNLDLTHKFDKREVKDANGDDAQLSARNAYMEMTVDFIPSGGSRAAAVAVGNTTVTPLAAVTLANFEVTACNGVWIYQGDSKLSLKNTENASYSLPLRRYTNTTQNTSLATVAT
jgi:hypothetical protein